MNSWPIFVCLSSSHDIFCLLILFPCYSAPSCTIHVYSSLSRAAHVSLSPFCVFNVCPLMPQVFVKAIVSSCCYCCLLVGTYEALKIHQNGSKMRKLWSFKNRAIKKLKMKISKHLKTDNLEQPNIPWMLMLLCCLWRSKMICKT